jgi:hypothetical protein
MDNLLCLMANATKYSDFGAVIDVRIEVCAHCFDLTEEACNLM